VYPTTMGHFERHHGSLRLAYTRFQCEAPILSAEDVLQAAIYCLNTTFGPERLVPALLVHGSIPRPARLTPALAQIQRGRAIDTARKELLREYAKQKIAVGLKYNGPYGAERSDLRGLLPGTPVRVFRPRTNTWEIFKFINIDKDTVTVQGSQGRRLFRSNVVHKLTGPSAVDHVQCSESACKFEDPTIYTGT
jgi:hypothetical protein